MAKAQDIIRIARNELGTKEDPAGSNHVKYNTEYYSQDISGSAYAWCCVFVWWVFRQAGASDLFYAGRKTAYVPTLDSWALNNGMCVQDPKPGDLIIYDWNNNKVADHIGICTGSTATTVTTIEGNADDAVRELTRQRSQVLRIIRPDYEQDQEPAGEYVTRTELRAWLQELLTKI